MILRPLSPDDIETLLAERLTPDGAGAFQWFGLEARTALRAKASADELVTAEAGALAVAVDGALAGSVEWFRGAWGRPETSWCWTIAIGLRPDARGHGVGRAAQAQLVDYLFAHTRAERVQAFTDHANVAEQRALEACGFAREGTIRRAQWRAGAWHDQLIYSILRGESA
ncbi:GNAT family N-acetyltransferase [Pengzhenrongella sicca]|uniref:GNAT family N-acetyltransferase n=1 Tax=Pengzhenrongella sicca TaxID=2819238 RepID=A0A8A4ZHI0_9MICO|nr:GNAT family N-acetyltransferase [Pengzhenrongella sicca]